MKPNFEPHVHTASDLVERDITLYLWPGAQLLRQLLSQFDNPEYRKIEENMFITKSLTQFYAMTKNELLIGGTHAMMRSSLFPDELAWATEYDHDQGRYKRNSGRGFYRGERVVLGGLLREAGWLTHKKWHLNEVINEHSHCSTESKLSSLFIYYPTPNTFVFILFRNWLIILFASSR